MTVEDIIARIEEERRRQGLTVTEMCEKARLNSKTFYTWRNGRNGPTVEALILMLDALGLTLNIETK